MVDEPRSALLDVRVRIRNDGSRVYASETWGEWSMYPRVMYSEGDRVILRESDGWGGDPTYSFDMSTTNLEGLAGLTPHEATDWVAMQLSEFGARLNNVPDPESSRFTRVGIEVHDRDIADLPWERALLGAPIWGPDMVGYLRLDRSVPPVPIGIPLRAASVGAEWDLDAIRDRDSFVEAAAGKEMRTLVQVPERSARRAPCAIVHTSLSALHEAPPCRLLVVHAPPSDERYAPPTGFLWEARRQHWHALLWLPLYDTDATNAFLAPFYRKLLHDWPLDRCFAHALHRCLSAAGDVRPDLSHARLVLRPGAETDLLLSRVVAESTGLLERGSLLEPEYPIAGDAPPERDERTPTREESSKGVDAYERWHIEGLHRSAERGARIRRQLDSMLYVPEAVRFEAADRVADLSGLSFGSEMTDLGYFMAAYEPSSRNRDRDALADALKKGSDEEVHERQSRFTQAWFKQGRQTWQKPLVVGKEIKLQVTVDSQRRSGVFATRFPRKRLREIIPPTETATLDVVLFFEPESFEGDRHATLRLPPTGSAEKPASFKLVPRKVGRTQLRIAIYCESVLLQSIAVDTEVASDARDGDAPKFRLDWVATTDFALLEEYRNRPTRMSVLVNDSESSHLLGIRTPASSNGMQRHLLGAKLNGLVKVARDALQNAHGGSYRYEKPQQDPLDDAEIARRHTSCTELARAGSGLFKSLMIFDDVVGRQDEVDAFKKDVAEPGILSVCRIAPSSTSVPWAMVYDRPLRRRGNLSLCENAFKYGPCIDQAIPCASNPHCSQMDPETTVCPYGFWGLRHQVEYVQGDVRALAGGGIDLAAVRQTESVSKKPKAVYGYDPKITNAGEHASQLREALGQLQLDSLNDIDRINEAINNRDGSLYYFMCHGRSDQGQFGLEFRNAAQDVQHIVATDLAKAGEERDFLVVMNACDSIALNAEVINLMLNALRILGAVGVLGTEVEVDRQYAMDFGVDFVKRLSAGTPMGQALLEARWKSFLETKTLSGLLYTAYGPSNLRFQD